MNKMKTTLLTSIALAACMSTSVFAQKSKESPITFTLSLDGQASVSTLASQANYGNWSQSPKYYKTTGIKKMTQTDIIKDIGNVVNIGFTTKAQLELVQGELSGFFNVIPDISESTTAYTDGTFGSSDGATNSSTVTSLGSDSTIISVGKTAVTYVALDSGRHYQTNPITGLAPIGHMQPWGQIFIKDPGQKGYSATSPFCTNVTFFFKLEVQECYDCFFMNSFISDATFTQKTTTPTQSGPPCCTVPATSDLLGHGKDQYYLTWSFDDTIDNDYLNPDKTGYYVGVQGITPTVSKVDGSTPDALSYSDPIKSGLGSPSPYEAKFTLNGIMTYTWNLEFVNSSDLLPDFVGTATYSANGYGFIQLVCRLITGSATITEKLATSTTCCLDLPWYDSWYGIGWDSASADDYVYETDAPGVVGTVATTQENTKLNLTYHQPSWPSSGPVVY